jgi:hypothetical protein
MEVVMVSRQFKIAVKMADRPAWKIAYEAGIHPNLLSKILSGAIRVKRSDKRVLRVADVLGICHADCFDDDQGGEQ